MPFVAFIEFLCSLSLLLSSITFSSNSSLLFSWLIWSDSCARSQRNVSTSGYKKQIKQFRNTTEKISNNCSLLLVHVLSIKNVWKCSQDPCSYDYNISWILCALLWPKKLHTWPFLWKSNQTCWLFRAIHGEIYSLVCIANHLYK